MKIRWEAIAAVLQAAATLLVALGTLFNSQAIKDNAHSIAAVRKQTDTFYDNYQWEKSSNARLSDFETQSQNSIWEKLETIEQRLLDIERPKKK